MGSEPLTLAQAFQRAVAAYQAGRLGEAAQLCGQINGVRNDIFEVFHLLAFVQAGLGQHEAALASCDRALALSPNHADALNNRGNILQKLNRFDQAIESYRQAIAARPDYVDAWSNQAAALHELKRFEEALACYDRALALRPDHPQILSNRGVTLQHLQRLDQALASHDRAVALWPNYAEGFYNRGLTLHELKRFDEALASYDRALALRPDYAQALTNRGISLRHLRRFDEALESYDRAIALQGRDPAGARGSDAALALNNRGITLQELKRFDEALESYDRAVAAQPAAPDPAHSREQAHAFNNRGVALQEMRRFDEALANYARAVAVSPDYAEAHCNQAFCHLATGDFARGFAQYEWRWQCDWMRTERRGFSQPLWLGREDIAGKRILIHAEQGYGDTIQFCRFVPLVAARGARVIMEVHRPLAPLIDGLSGVDKIVAKGDRLPDFDLHCPLLSLPLVFGTRLETIPATVPYLEAPAATAVEWRRRLELKRWPRVGLAWSGNPVHKNDHNRSIRLEALLPLTEMEGTFIGLQKDVRPADAAVLRQQDRLTDISSSLNDFAVTAGVIAALDIVIAVDTAVAHLAGAMGKRVWVLLPYTADWRWQLDRPDSPWYPTAQLFRQDQSYRWEGVISRVREALAVFAR